MFYLFLNKLLKFLIMNFEKPTNNLQNNFRREKDLEEAKYEQALKRTLKALKNSVSILKTNKKYIRDIKNLQETIDWLEKRIKELKGSD